MSAEHPTEHELAIEVNESDERGVVHYWARCQYHGIVQFFTPDRKRCAAAINAHLKQGFLR